VFLLIFFTMEFGLLSVTPVPKVLAWGTSPGPTTYEEWQAAIWEVKSLNQSQQYKHCVSRCKQLLEAGAGPVRITISSV
jgi:hypothetical protein